LRSECHSGRRCPIPSGEVGVPYSTTLVGSGGTPPLTWSVNASGPAMIAGLILDSDSGVLSGTPTEAATRSPLIDLTDSIPNVVEKALTITVYPAVTITSAS